MSVLGIAFKSLWNRRTSTILTILSIAISIFLLLGIERVKKSSRESFETTISGTDLLVGARTGQVQLLLYLVFRMGNAPNNISWKSYEEIKNNPDIEWTIPLSLGDSYKGYRVLSTDDNYFKFYQYGRNKHIEFSQGKKFSKVFDAVLGANVARKLDLKLGDLIALTHGISEKSFVSHGDKPFEVVGILDPTGTPVDNTVHINLEGMEAIHVDWKDGGAPGDSEKVSVDQVLKMNLKPMQLTGFMVGLKSKFGIFTIQRDINTYEDEALMAVLPGVGLQELWNALGNVELTLSIISWIVLFAGILGMVNIILATLNERRREMAIFRAVGARSLFIFSLLMMESIWIVLLGFFGGFLLLQVSVLILSPMLLNDYGINLIIEPGIYEIQIFSLALIFGIISASWPGIKAYRNALHDGLSIKV